MLTFAVNKVNKDHKIFLIFYFYSPYPPTRRFCRVGLWEKEGNKQKYKSEKKNSIFIIQNKNRKHIKIYYNLKARFTMKTVFMGDFSTNFCHKK
jgi:hypothetical protein